MKKLPIITLTLALLASPLAFAQSTHPSENYPGKAGNQDATNGAPNSPEQKNPSTGQQNTGSSSSSSSNKQ